MSRIDIPHASSSGSPCKVLDLASNPSDSGFATIGEDGALRIWQPTARRRNGVDVRGKDGRTLVSWTCRQVIELQVAETVLQHKTTGKVAFSADGSVLATSLYCESAPAPAVHLIDTLTGNVRLSPTHLYNGPLYGLAILHRYLILLSTELRVWDMVTSETSYGFAFEPIHTLLSSADKHATTHLAVEHSTNTFAVAIPERQNAEVRSHIAIFDPEDPAPLFTQRSPKMITNLIPAAGRRGFYCVDAAAELRIVVPEQVLPTLPEYSPEEPEASKKSLQNVYGNGNNLLQLESMQVKTDESADQTRVVNREKLAEVFEIGGAGNAMPKVGDLYEKVARLFVGKEAE